METKFISDFNYGASLEILGEDNNVYLVQFFDNKTNTLIHQSEITCNHWTRSNRKYFTEWKIVVLHNGIEVFTETFDCRGKNVLIASTSRALGDNIAHAPYFEEFRKKHNCNLTVATNFWWFLKDYYPNIKWMNIGLPLNEYGVQYAHYSVSIGIDMDTFDKGIDKINNSHNNIYNKVPVKYIKGLTFFDVDNNPEHPLLIPIQKQVSNVLGLEYKEIRPHFEINLDRPIMGKYICISEFASGPTMKLWNNQVGWKNLISELKSRGYEIISISKEKSELNGIIKRNGDYTLIDRMQYMKHAEFFIGVSSGLSWLNWALGKKTVMISGFTVVSNEFQEDNIRIKNENVCGGCYNSEEHADNLCCHHKDFCPTNKNFECTRKISPKMVIDKMIENNLI